MEVTVHDGEVAPLVAEWTELYLADDRATPFQSPAWILAWRRHWGRALVPRLLCVRDQGTLVGLAPLWQHRMLGLRVLRVNGEPADYWNVLSLPDYRPDVEHAIAAELRRRRPEWDLLVLSRLPHDSGLVERLGSLGLPPVHHGAERCPAVSLPDTFDAYLSALPGTRRREIRRILRRLDTGLVALRAPAVEELPAALSRWQALRVRQWAAQGRRILPVHKTPRFRRFLIEVTTELLPLGRAAVWELVHDGDVVGSFVNFCDPRAFYHYLGGFAPELPRLKLGHLATAHGIRSSIAAGRRVYDFTRGAEDYKYWFGSTDRLSPTVLWAGGRAPWARLGPAGAVAARLWG